jgi:hypothetical protein
MILGPGAVGLSLKIALSSVGLAVTGVLTTGRLG